jgi:hypothetical protein
LCEVTDKLPCSQLFSPLPSTYKYLSLHETKGRTNISSYSLCSSTSFLLLPGPIANTASFEELRPHIRARLLCHISSPTTSQEQASSS